ncbi:MAG TPA: ABC transporter ATP-binding protein [bacterium]|nr:ABC transporter ATP-binding protein [bacterium]
MRVLLTAQGLNVSIGSAAILHDISLELPEHGILSVIGPNGAGKSTLLKCLAGLLAPTAGRVELAGKEIGTLSGRDRAKMIAVVPQEANFTVPFTVAAFIELARYPHRGSFSPLTAADRTAIGQAVAVTGIAPLLPRTVTTLSGGEKRLVLIAAALAQESPLLLLDEPTAALDPAHRAALLRLLKKAHGELGRTIVLVTHEVNDALFLGGNVLGLKKGRVSLPMIAVDALALPALGALFDIPFAHWQDPAGRRLVAPEVSS